MTRPADMASAATDNPPAFPCRDGPDLEAGMSLRDWFAGQALAGLIAADKTDTSNLPSYSYQIADDMLAERVK